MDKNKFCVFTGLFGNYEKLNEQPVSKDSNIDFICFTDNPNLQSETWKINHTAPLFEMDQVRSSRFIKICAHKFLQQYETSLYIDNSVKLLAAPENIFNDLFENDAIIALIPHSFRESVLDEFTEVLNLQYDHPNIITEQINAYSIVNKDIFEEKPFWGGFMIRKHNTEKIVSAMDDWFYQVCRYSRRDQLSLNYILDKHDIKPVIHHLDNGFSKYHQWPVVERYRQKKVINDAIFSSINTGAQYINLQRQFSEAKQELDQQSLALSKANELLEQANQQFSKAKQELEQQSLALSKMKHELDQIKSSRAWKIALLIRRVRVILVPPNTWREKLARSLLHWCKFFGKAEGRKSAPDAPSLHINKSSAFHLLRIAPQIIAQKGGIWRTGAAVLRVYRREGFTGIKHRINKQYTHPQAARDQDYMTTYRSYFDSASRKKGPEFAPIDESGITLDSEGVKMIAFYLPQFHPIPTNNAAWGRGFTEWTNVSKATPQFVGHYQPHLPGELGFYDLRVPDTQKRQVELAKLYGIWGFCFYYYWFDGRRLLEKPIEQFVSDKSLDLKFCLCWANENWTKRWDGLNKEVIIAQNHTAQDDIAFIKSIEHMLRDERYIRIGGRPLLIVYHPKLLPDAATTAARWRKYCRRAGIGDLFLVAAQTFHTFDPRPFEFDAAVEFPPQNVSTINITAKAKLLNPAFKGNVYDYEYMVARRCALILNTDHEKWLTFRTVVPSWDNEARRSGAGDIYHGATPAVYSRWLKSASAATAKNTDPDARLLFINAWNEWAEGAHLEPDQKFGYAWLAATKCVARQYSTCTPQPHAAVILHLFYPDLWDEFCTYLLNIPVPFDLFITVPEDFPQLVRSRIQVAFPSAKIIIHENRGRDVLPFYAIFSSIPLGRYDYICKVHSKKSTHRPDGKDWRAECLNALLGSSDQIRKILDQFDSHPGIGVVGSGGMILQSSYYWGDSERTAGFVQKLSDRIGIVGPQKDFVFVAGTMFWFRPQAFSRLRALNLESSEFETEAGQVHGTLAHALERFLGLLVLTEGYSIADTSGKIFTSSDCNWMGDGTDVIRVPWAAPTLNGLPF